jgi:hypothetical protein
MTQELVFLTCHGKETAVAAALRKHGYAIQTYSDFDTDSLGTFTGETSRDLTQAQTALKKAQLACELTGKRFGLGSEGSFGPHPQAFLLPWNIEVLAFWDSQNQHAVYAIHGTAHTNFASEKVSSMDAGFEFAEKVLFPSHALVLGTPSDVFFKKGMTHLSDFKHSLENALTLNPSVWLETDMRAHLNPSRMRTIQHTAEKLAALLVSDCPQCQLPGYGLTEMVKGAPCEICATPTRIPKAEKWHCLKCEFTEMHPLNDVAPAKNCDTCNP